MSDNKKRATHFFDQLSNQGDLAMIDTDVWSDLIGSWHSVALSGSKTDATRADLLPVRRCDAYVRGAAARWRGGFLA